MALISARRRPLLLPGTSTRAVRRPDLSHLSAGTPSAFPLTADEVDYDDLVILRTWRVYHDDRPAEVKYFCYELAQTDPGAPTDRYYKAVRLIRLTRVPRYLRNTGSEPFSQMRDVLVGLREKRVLFVNMIAKAPALPLIFAYGVQGVGDTLSEAMLLADEAYAALSVNLDGTYQQLEYAPLNFTEAEAIARYQAEWGHVGMARGRPIPQGVSLGSSAILDGNRTDVENTNQQLESFIRGMGDRSFMLNLVTYPMAPEELNRAWDNVTRKLSAVRSDQSGSRGVSAGVALPLGMGTSAGQGSGTTHGTTGTTGMGTSDGVSTGATHTTSASESTSTSTSLGQSTGQTDTVSSSQGVSTSDGLSSSLSDSSSASHSTSLGVTDGLSHGVSSGQSVSQSQTAGSNWSSGANQSVSAGQSLSDNWSTSTAQSLSQTLNQGTSDSTGQSGSNSSTEGNNVSGGVPLLGGGQNSSAGTTWGANTSHGINLGQSLSGGSSNTSGVGSSSGTSLTGTRGLSESTGGSLSQGVTAGTNVGQSDSASRSSSASQGDSVSLGQTTGQGASQGVGTSNGLGQSSALSRAASLTQTQGNSSSTGVSDATSQSTTASSSQQQALSDAWSVAMSRQVSQTGSLGVVPTFSANFSRNTYNEGKKVIGDILEAQRDRLLDAIEGGGYQYQMFLVTPDRETLIGATSLLKSAFWAPGGESKRLPSPFHTIVVDDPAESSRLLTHSAAFSTYRRREPQSEIVEPYLYSTFVTTGEASTFCHPPTSEAVGLQAQTDSMPVMSMPADRTSREVYLGHVINGERGRVSDTRFGIDLDELTHILIQGVTGLGKTTTMLRLLEQAATVSRTLTTMPTMDNPVVSTKTVHAGVLALDWMQNARKLAAVVPADRFQLFSVSNPTLGAFRFNPLELPHPGMDPGQWLGAQADNLAASFGLGDYGRSIIAEALDKLYAADRLSDFVLRPAVVDDLTGTVLRPAITLPAVTPGQVPASGIALDATGQPYANVYTYPQLSRLVGLPQLAVLIATKMEEAATPDGARLMGTEMRNRLQSVWRRLQYYAPGNPMASMLRPDPSLDVRECLGVPDLIDPDRGLVTVIETDGLDLENRRVVLGSVMLAVYRYGLHVGSGAFDHLGKGPGTFIVLEEAHELFGEAGENEDRTSAAMRANLYESLFRRARQTGLRLVAMTQNCGQVPAAITSQTTTVFVHRTYDDADRKRVFSLLNWSNMIGQQQREWRYLGELPPGYCIVRLNAKNSYLESAPVQILVDAPELPNVSDAALAALAAARPRR